MTKTRCDLEMKEFMSQALNATESWLKAMNSRQNIVAAETCHHFIEQYKSDFRSRNFNITESDYNTMLVVLIFMRGIFDCTRLSLIVDSNTDWDKDNKTLEFVWITLCDAWERLAFSYSFCQGRAIDMALLSLNRLERYYLQRFGSGSYVSPGIESDGCLCSICLQDIRACSHVPGKLYNGTFCSMQPINPSPAHVALVDSPADRRCRIWPWNIEDPQDGEVKISMMVMCSFSLDCFLFEDVDESQIH